ncbi:MAG: hypothetical protein ACT6RL_05060 [Neoaquamicrobium sediminum]|uniref:hypothetical protein n=1 Tax=Neoaquamicrobium sediminum TaxID=1849104 RepID=UPI00403587B2
MVDILRVTKMTDQQIIKLIDALTNELEFKNLTLRVGDVPVEYPSETVTNFLKGKNLQAISTFDTRSGTPPVTVRFRRGIGGTVANLDATRVASPYFDEIAIEAKPANTGQTPSVETIVAVKKLISRHIKLPDTSSVNESSSEAIDLLKFQFSQLNEQLLEINTTSLKRRETLEDEYSEKRQQLEEELARHSEQLREKVEKLDFDHKLRLEALEAREKQLDDRDHIHARRELRTHITDAIAEQLKGDLVPRKASAMRWSVLGLLLLGAAGLGITSAWSLYEFGQLIYLGSLREASGDVIAQRAYAMAQLEAGGHWLVLARGFISATIAIGFLLYAISWLKALYHDEVKTRRELQRYATDLSRASWAIETIMEAKASGDVVIPDAVMTGVTRNLFETPGTGKASNETSANALAELLRTSGKARFGPNGAEFELSSRGANKLADKIDQ